VVPLVGHSQAASTDRLLKVCTPGRETHCRFSWGLEEAGYAEGRNLLIKYRYAMAIAIGCQTWRAISFVGISKS
jgi:hypothetical protein